MYAAKSLFWVAPRRFKTAQEGSKTFQDGTRRLQKELLKHIGWETDFLKMYIVKSLFLLAPRRRQNGSRGSKTLQDGAITVSNAHTAPSKDVVEAYRLKDSFLIDVYSQITVLAGSKTPQDDLRRLKHIFRRRKYEFKCTEGVFKRCCWRI